MTYRVNLETMSDAIKKASNALDWRRDNYKVVSGLEYVEQAYNVRFAPHDDNGTMKDDLDIVFPSEQDYVMFMLKWS